MTVMITWDWMCSQVLPSARQLSLPLTPYLWTQPPDPGLLLGPLCSLSSGHTPDVWLAAREIRPHFL